jgi:hypothetical protein
MFIVAEGVKMSRIQRNMGRIPAVFVFLRREIMGAFHDKA